MLSLLSRAHLIFVGAFFVACAIVLAYQLMVIWPARQCEAQGGWWDPKDRECGAPIPIWRITGRGGPHGAPPPISVLAPQAKR